MKTNECLSEATRQLQQAGIGTARLDTLVLLEDVTGIDRAQLLAEPEHEIAAGQVQKLTKLLKRRAQHEPLAYVRGKAEFYGREFVISPAVLQPRPESETMIDELKKLPNLPSRSLIADIGTGSGALGITAGLELHETQIDLIDIDEAALEVAKINVDLFTSSARIYQGDLLKATDSAYDVLLCNLPYVPDDYHINTSALHEPRLAIFGGPDGLDVYRKLFEQLKSRQNKPLYILTECLPMQHRALATIARSADYEKTAENDFIQIFIRTQKLA